MESTYDEDLSENIFFKALKTEHGELFEKATQDGWIICIPRVCSLPKYALTYEDFFNHILIPSEELPETHFRTLNDQEIRICNRIISIEADGGSTFSTQILFEETYYTDEMLKYKVLCIDNPLDINLENTNDASISNIQTLRDCIDLLWTESKGKEIFEKMDEAIKMFLLTNDQFEYNPFDKQKYLVEKLYQNCLNICLKDNKLRQSISINKYLIDSIKLAVETYMHHGIYKTLIKGITACTALEDAQFNKMIRNLSDIQLKDLDIREDLYDTVPRARSEISHIDCYSTILGKIGCVRRCISAISKEDTRDKLQGNIITVDDLLPMIVFLVVKCALPNWIAHLTYMKQFHFSQSSNVCIDQDSFLITSLEASIEHIKSGLLIGPSEPEALMSYDDQEELANAKFKPTVEMSDLTTQLKVYNKYNNYKKISSLTKLFEFARLGDGDKVRAILQEENKKEDSESLPLCHPLCSCDDCEEAINLKHSQSKPTTQSMDDRGFTVLHVAALYGRIKVVDLVLELGADTNSQDLCGCSPLHYAATRGHQNVLLLLLHSGASINLTDNEGNTALHLATNNGHETCVKALIYFNEQEVLNLNINAVNNQGDSPLHAAARWGYTSIIQLLLDHGANPTLENKRKVTPLQNANNLHVAKLLNAYVHKPKPLYNYLVPKEKVSRPPSPPPTQDKYLDYSDVNEANISNVNVREGVRPRNITEIKKVEQLFALIENNEIKLIKSYFGLSNEEKVPDNACHPLCQCAKCKEDVVESESRPVTDECLNINICNSDGYTALHIATSLGHYDLVRLLINYRADINIVTRVKQLTPLHIACQNNNLSIVRLLLAAKQCNVNAQDYRGNTALHYAAINNHTNLATLLLKSGARPQIKNHYGQTCLHMAQQMTSLSLVRVLTHEAPFVLK
ncbi:ankyrin repeat domain-containing protein 27-like isoform X2 [Diaphorina citri]|nr:ankyrin repeat domain-containing protein 27-like isoform X2 [Diaphorina citri]XP_026679344.1 ankyrin repeat domain-containing protein 27-like isoform X2 [Diaphorina citri]XP_026679345.1 ankyrin repeat domain-containing protein 27-like isoform X2 [Diaphorina citri]